MNYLIAVIMGIIGVGIGFNGTDTRLGDTGTVNTLNPWKVTSSYILPRNDANGIQVPALVSCDTIDTDADGKFACGTDDGGAGGTWATSSSDYWAQNDLKLQELSDVQDPNAWGQLLMWTGSVWATTSTSSLGIAGVADGDWSTTSADYWETTQTARTADDLSNNTTTDLTEGTNLYWTSERGTTSFNTLFAANTSGWDTTTADDWSTTSSNYWETQQTARTADDLTNNSIENLQDVLDGITENFGDLLYWNGTVWADLATSSLAVAWSNLVGIPAGFADGTDDTGSDTLDDLSNNSTSDLAEGSNLYWTTARGTSTFNTLFMATTTGWDTNVSDDWSTTSSNYWETQQTARTADDLTNNSIENLNDVLDGITENWGDLLYWNGTAWADLATSSLAVAWSNLVGIPAGFADGTDDTGTDTLDDLTNNSIEDLNDVAAMTENFGDLLYWNGSTWTDTATSGLNISTTNITEGTKLFYTDARVGTYLIGSTSLTIATTTVTGSITVNGGATSTFPRLSVTTAFNFLGDYITNTATWFLSKLQAVSAFIAAASSTWDFGGATSLEIPNGTGPTVDTIGEIALDTTDDQLLYADSGGTARVFGHDEFRIISTTIASTSIAFTSGQTLPVLSHKDGLEITQYSCYVVGGTSKVLNLTDGTNDTETITCGTTLTSDTDVATNDTFTAGELGYIEFGATTGTVNYVHFEAWARITRE